MIGVESNDDRLHPARGERLEHAPDERVRHADAGFAGHGGDLISPRNAKRVAQRHEASATTVRHRLLVWSSVFRVNTLYNGLLRMRRTRPKTVA